MKKSIIEKLMKNKKAIIDNDYSQPQAKQAIATSGTLKIQVEGKSNGKTNN